MLGSPSDFCLTLRQLERDGVIRHAEWFDELDSTNSHAIRLAEQNAETLPRLVGASRQTAGRGRGGNSWWSTDGALMFSLLFNPQELKLPWELWPQIALATGLAVADMLESYLPPALVQLKWPNDVYVDGRKICGILTEVPPGRMDRLVVGIGLNLGNSLATAPDELRASAVSLIDLLGENCPATGDVLASLIVRWQVWVQRLAAGEIDFPALWKTKCYLTGHVVTVTIGPQTQTGLCLGLDTDGVLLLDTSSGIQRILAGTVRKLAP